MKTASPTGLKFPTFIGKKLHERVKQLVEKMGQCIKQSEKRLTELEAKQQEQKRENQSHIFEFVISPILRSTKR